MEKRRKYRQKKKLNRFLTILLIIVILFFVFKLLQRTFERTTLSNIGEYEEIHTSPDQVISDLNQLTPKTKELALKFIEACKAQGLDVRITETYRSQERQNYLYEQGRSRPGPVVTWTKNSRHTKRSAFDICKNGNDPYGDEDFFRRCAEIGRDLGLNPGYFWTPNQDKPHFQYDTLWNH